MHFRPDYKPAKKLDIEDKMKNIKGTVDFEDFTEKMRLQKQKKKQRRLEQSQNESVMNTTTANGVAVEQNMLQSIMEEPSEVDPQFKQVKNKMERDTEFVAPSIGVAEQLKKRQQRIEEAERMRNLMIERQKNEEENLLNQHYTNLPLELIYRQKMEKKLREQMEAAGIKEDIKQTDISLNAAQNIERTENTVNQTNKAQPEYAAAAANTQQQQ